MKYDIVLRIVPMHRYIRFVFFDDEGSCIEIVAHMLSDDIDRMGLYDDTCHHTNPFDTNNIHDDVH